MKYQHLVCIQSLCCTCHIHCKHQPKYPVPKLYLYVRRILNIAKAFCIFDICQTFLSLLYTCIYHIDCHHQQGVHVPCVVEIVQVSRIFVLSYLLYLYLCSILSVTCILRLAWAVGRSRYCTQTVTFSFRGCCSVSYAVASRRTHSCHYVDATGESVCSTRR